MVKFNADYGRAEDLNCCGGHGAALIQTVLEREEVYTKTVFFGIVTLCGSSTVGYHVHQGDMEIYTIIEGRGVFNDNGKEVEVGVMDTTVTYSGEGHAIRPLDGEKLKFLCCVIAKE